MTQSPKKASAPIPDSLRALHKAAQAYAVALRKSDVEGEPISNETLNEIERDLDVACFDFSQTDHRNSDFKPAAFVLLIEQIAGKQEELDEDDQLRERLAKILTDTTNALHGGRLKNGLWSWHDLAELAAKQRTALVAATKALRSYEYETNPKGLAEKVADDCQALLYAREEDTEHDG